MSILDGLFGDLARAVGHDHYVPAPGEPGDHIYVSGYGPCQVWSYGPGYRGRWVIPLNQNSEASAVLVHWTPDGQLVIDQVQLREGTP